MLETPKSFTIVYVSNNAECEGQMIQNAIEREFNAKVVVVPYTGLIDKVPKEVKDHSAQCLVIVIPNEEMPALLSNKTFNFGAMLPKTPMVWIRSSANLNLYSLRSTPWVRTIDTCSYQTQNLTELLMINIAELTQSKRASAAHA